jgi:hypothetical protein
MAIFFGLWLKIIFSEAQSFTDKHASWYAEKTHSEGSSLYDTYITFTR